MTNKTRSRFAAALLCGTAISGVLGTGPGAGEARSDGIETVVVTAQRRSENILNVPYNISRGLAGARIEQTHVLDTAELLRSIPGVSTVDRGERSAGVVNGSIRIRGLNVDSSALGDYCRLRRRDGSRPMSTTRRSSRTSVSQKDIDRTSKVLKGPQGTLYGSGALGGTVRYILNQPNLDGYSASITADHEFVDARTGPAASDRRRQRHVQRTDHRHAGLSRHRLHYYDYPGVTDYVRTSTSWDSNGLAPVLPPGNGILSTDAVLEDRKDADWYRGWYGRAAPAVEADRRIST